MRSDQSYVNEFHIQIPVFSCNPLMISCFQYVLVSLLSNLVRSIPCEMPLVAENHLTTT
jgi:hypothetical protein